MRTTTWAINGDILTCVCIVQASLSIQSVGRTFATSTLVASEEIPAEVITAFPSHKAGNTWLKKFPEARFKDGRISFCCEWEYAPWPEEIYGKPL